MSSKSTNKTLFILVVAVILPVGIFTFFQLRNLMENEEILREVQKSQLQTIIFSINQHSDEVMRSMQIKLENISSIPTLGYEGIMEKYPGFREVLIVEDSLSGYIQLSSDTLISEPELRQLMDRHSKTFEKLKEYKDVGFSKLEPLPAYQGRYGNYSLLSFVIQDVAEKKSVCLVFMDPVLFIEQFLAPKMQELATDNYVITASSIIDKNLVFATDSTENEGLQTLPLWLLPDYNVNVTLKGESAASISDRRLRLNLIWIGILITFLILGFVIIVRNLRKEMQLAQLKSDFVSSVSHEIRTPLALINMFAETLLLDRVRDEKKKKEYYEIISKETSRLKNIVNKILNFSQMETQRRSHSLVEQSLNEIVSETLKTYSYHLENKGFNYQIEYASGNMTARLDAEAVTEALINLIDNAMKYSAEKKEIHLKTGGTDQEIYVEVKDYGMGISAKNQKLIFDKFYRVTKGDIYNVRGAGLGLSITKSIIDAHNGRIEVRSEEGKGSTFRLVFPRINKN
ncbi:MAG: HAMP domain-containing sensor histidine kinase [Cyclobacteriaceae bacterium]